MNPLFIGVEIGGTKLQIVCGQSDGTILDRKRYQVDPGQGAAGIRQHVEEGVRALMNEHAGVQGIGVGFGGPLDRTTGNVACSHQIEGWAGFSLKNWLQDLSGLSAVVDNDANVAALGEALKGAGIGFNPVFYVTLGSGVGGGAVVDNQIYHGAHPGESEIGHIRLDVSGRIVEEVCSGWAVDRRIREAISQDQDCLLAKVVGGRSKGEATCLNEALDGGCEVAGKILEETTRSLAFALSHVVHLMHPEAIILGGGLSLIGDRLIQGVAEQLPHWVMKAFLPAPQVKQAVLREDVVPVGALLMAGQMKARS